MTDPHPYTAILKKVQNRCLEVGRTQECAELVCVSKTFEPEDILPVLECGCRVFGENRVQETQRKWPDLLQKFPDVQLHLIGPLQSNKASVAVELFDFIHTIDREKIAKTIAGEMKRQNKNPGLFVQVNIGDEIQKSGVEVGHTSEFVNYLRQDLSLDPLGLMCIPPLGENPGPYFALLAKLARQCNCSALSMGMSSDYELAIELGATHVRVGSAILGDRQ